MQLGVSPVCELRSSHCRQPFGSSYTGPSFREDMAKDEDEYIRMRGTVLKMLPDSTFEVKLDSGFELLAKPSGRMRRGRGIRVLPGDTVDVEVSTYDPTRGRIVWRYR